MITLYGFGPFCGLPDGSPFVLKVMTLLNFAGVDYREERSTYSRAPKGKLPFIDDDGRIVADSTFIRWHIEKTRGIDFDRHLTAEQRAIAWAVEKMCEDHLYWLMVRDRWLDDGNFARGPAKFFESVPSPVRPFAQWLVRRKIANRLHLQGAGRYSADEAARLSAQAVETLAALIDDKPYLFGDAPCAADAAVFSFLAWPISQSSLRDAVESRANLVAYRDRIMQKYFPSFAEARGGSVASALLTATGA